MLEQDPSPSATKGLGNLGRSLPATVIPICQEGGSKDPGTFRPVRPTSVPGKTMEKIVFGTVARCLKNNAVIRSTSTGHKGKVPFN